MKTIVKLFAHLFKAMLALLIITILTPVVYFAWRAGQPMVLPEFKGLTYYQFIEWRKMAFNDLAAKYQVQHPDKKVSAEIACDGAVKVVTLGITIPQTGIFTLASLNGAKPDPAHSLPTDVTWFNFMPKWWSTFEVLELYNAYHYQNISTRYCRIQPNIPTPEELEALKEERKLSALKP